MSALAPVPQLIPEDAPFTGEQRAWLNDLFVSRLGLGGQASDVSFPAPTEPEEEFPWHDPALAMDERLKLAGESKPERRLMAAMAQLDCGQCGYLCQTYAEALWSGAESDRGRCVPGGKETQRKLKELMVALGPERDSAPAPAIKTASALGTRERPALATLVDAHPLTRSGSDKDVRHVVLDLSTTDLSYEAGDSLGVYARKNPQLVQAVLDRLGASGEEMVAFDDEALPLRQVLLSKVDISRPSDESMEFLASRAFSENDVRQLIELSRGEGPPHLAEADLLDLLMAFPSVMPSLPGLLKSLDRLQPRLYSIASSSKAHPREVHLTVSAVRWDGRDRERTGVGSCYLADFAKPGDVIPVFVQKSHGFAVPANDDVPMVMVGPGTGVAPFRAFLEEREARRAKGRNWLFFGDQKRTTDFIYEDEIIDWQRRGILTRLDTAFSRDQADKVYVQHRMRENARELWGWLEAGAYFYVCGDAKRMAKDVEDTLVQIASEQGGKGSDAKAWLNDLARAGRYQRDVY